MGKHTNLQNMIVLFDLTPYDIRIFGVHVGCERIQIVLLAFCNRSCAISRTELSFFYGSALRQVFRFCFFFYNFPLAWIAGHMNVVMSYLSMYLLIYLWTLCNFPFSFLLKPPKLHLLLVSKILIRSAQFVF